MLRHGQSERNAAGIFTGWENPHLTGYGEAEAARAGADRDWIPVRRSWRLNGRNHGDLQGRNKARVRTAYGDRQFTL